MESQSELNYSLLSSKEGMKNGVRLIVDNNENRSVDKFVRFENWLRENGAEFSCLELRAYDDSATSSRHHHCKPSSTSSTMSDMDWETVEEKKEMFSVPLKSSLLREDQLTESEMRGVHAKVAIPPDTICLSIPRKCLITVEMGQETPLGKAILESELDLDAPKHIFLMIYLLWDRKVNGDSSFFKPYYDILPKHLWNMPIFWSNDELAYLEGSYLLEQISDRIEAIREDYEAICEVAPELACIATLEEFQWARMCVCSRNFGLQIDGVRTSALVPHADMLNHYRPRETKWTFDEDKQVFTVTTIHSIQAGAQVYDSYGQKCNHRFLLNYGFAVEDNRESDGFCPNEVSIELSIPPGDPCYEAKVNFWTQGNVRSMGMKNSDSSNLISPTHGNSPPSTIALDNVVETVVHSSRIRSSSADSTFCPIKRIRVCISNNENNKILLSLCRVIACNQYELQTILDSSTAPSSTDSLSNASYVGRVILGLTTNFAEDDFTNTVMTYNRTCRDIRQPINLRNEKAAMEVLFEIIKNALSKYPTTLAQDIKDLSDEIAYPRFSNKRHAKIQVRGEKEILHFFGYWSRTALDVISIIEKELAIERGDMPKSVLKNQPDFDHIIQSMEDQEGFLDSHNAIVLRYCCDVLGTLRRDEMKYIRRQRITQ